MINSLLWVLWYNGYEEAIKKLYEYISKYDHNIPQVPYPHDEDILSKDHDAPDRILWSVLVMEYGDYGTSPRFGWIQKPQKVKEALEEWLNMMKGGNE